MAESTNNGRISMNGQSARDFWYKVAKDFGVSTIFLIVILAIYTGHLSSPLLTTIQNLDAHATTVQQIKERIDRSDRLWRQICRNTARTQAQSDKCED